MLTHHYRKCKHGIVGVVEIAANVNYLHRYR